MVEYAPVDAAGVFSLPVGGTGVLVRRVRFGCFSWHPWRPNNVALITHRRS
jgi:hypothetical protein